MWRETEETGGTGLPLARKYVGHLSRVVGHLHGANILDFGAGRGEMLIALAEVGAGAYAVEPFGAAFLEAQGLRAYRALSDLPPGLRFDGIVMNNVIEHLPRPGDVLPQLRRVLVRGGWLFVATPNMASLRIRLHGARDREMQKAGHVILFGPTGLRRLLERSGFGKCRRLRWRLPHPRPLLHCLLQSAGMDGELRYIARRLTAGDQEEG